MDTGTHAAIERYLDAMAAGAMASVLACVTDDVLLLTCDGPLHGREAFATHWGRMLRGIFTPGTYERHIDALVVEGDLAMLVWRAECLGTEITHGVSHFWVRDGRISRMTGILDTRPV